MKHLIRLFAILTVVAACNKPQEQAGDPETTLKDDAFRSGIKTGQFQHLTDGYTYYELANPQADTTIVMVHGFSVPSYIWDSTFQAASKRGYRALRYDTYGRGFSDNPDVSYNVELFTNQLQGLLDSLGIAKPVTLMGLSDGGRTISAFASTNPGRVQNLVYVDAAGFENLTPKDSIKDNGVTEEEILAFKQSDRYRGMAAGQLSDFYDSTRFRGWDRKYSEVMKYKGFVRAIISTGKNRRDLTIEHRRIAGAGIPAFAIWGENDQVVKLEDVRANMNDRIPGMKIIALPNAGHLPHMEQVSQFNEILFNQIIRRKL